MRDYEYEVEIPPGVRGCMTTEDLQRHLDSDAHERDKLVSAQFVNGNWVLIWELYAHGSRPRYVPPSSEELMKKHGPKKRS